MKEAAEVEDDRQEEDEHRHSDHRHRVAAGHRTVEGSTPKLSSNVHRVLHVDAQVRPRLRLVLKAVHLLHLAVQEAQVCIRLFTVPAHFGVIFWWQETVCAPLQVMLKAGQGLVKQTEEVLCVI